MPRIKRKKTTTEKILRVEPSTMTLEPVEGTQQTDGDAAIESEPAIEKVSDADDSTLVEYRDATFSRPTRDELAKLAGWLHRRNAVLPEQIAALDDVIARWDANDATAIYIDSDDEIVKAES